MVAVGDADPATIVATLRHALESLTQLSTERASLEEALKVQHCQSGRVTDRLRHARRGVTINGSSVVCGPIATLLLPCS